MPEKQETTRRGETSLSRRESTWPTGPARMFNELTAEMDRLFDSFGLGLGWPRPRATDWLRSRQSVWIPELEIFQRNNDLVIRADLPGLAKDDVRVDVTDDSVTIQGERRSEHEEDREGLYRSERSYGNFYRVLALPEGAMSDQAKATFKDGVLEITMPAPPESVKRGRRLEITETRSK
jgi:HSP20 family protein